MTTLPIAMTAYSIQAAKPNQRYGQLSRLPVRFNESAVLFRAALHRVPAGATVTSATVEFTQWSDEGGSRTLRLRPIDEGWNSNVTWGNRPSVGAEVDAVTLAAPQRGATWSFDVTTEVQEVVSGQRTDRGWQLAADSAVSNTLTLKGSAASTRWPRLVVVYTMTPPAPENLHPASGAVSVAKPVLTFDASDSIIALQVQVDPGMDEVTPDFDSGTLAAAGGYLDLADTAYAGLAADATTSWRVRQETGGGWSDWSEWVDFTRLAKATLTITNPGATSDDGTPPVTWTFTGTQTAWEARLLDAAGDVLDESGYTPGTDLAWTPERGLTTDGQVGTIELLVWDDSERVAVPGDPEYVIVTQEITYTLDPTVDPVTTLVATRAVGAPDVILTGTRTGGIPDEVDVFRNGVKVARHVGTDVFTGTAYTITDVLPPVGKPLTYRVAPRVDGLTASGGPTATLTVHAKGIWIVDLEDTDNRVHLYGDVPEQAQPETAVVHTPLLKVAGAGQVVRRRLVRYRPQGAVTGTVTDLGHAGVPSAATCEALLRDWADFDAGHRFRLVFSGFDGDCIIGDLTFTEVDNPSQETRRTLDVSMNYWGQAPA